MTPADVSAGETAEDLHRSRHHYRVYSSRCEPNPPQNARVAAKKRKEKKTPAEEKKKEERKINFLDVYTLLREEFLLLFHARVVDACYRESAGVSARSVCC